MLLQPYPYTVSPPGSAAASAAAQGCHSSRPGADHREVLQTQPRSPARKSSNPSEASVEGSRAINTPVDNKTPNWLCKVFHL